MSERVVGLKLLLPLVALGVAASLVIDLDAVKTLIGSSAVRVTIKALALALSAGSGVYSYIRSEQRHRESSRKQERREALSKLEATLASSIQNLFVGELPQNIRANLMIVSGYELRMLASANLLVFPDYNVRLRKGQGCAGVAWERAVEGPIDDCWKPVYATTVQLKPSLLKARWKLTEEQIRQTSHILWILSIPLFRKSEGQRTFLGVLNYDGVHKALIHPATLSEPDFVGRCVAMGERVAEVVASEWAIASGQVDASASEDGYLMSGSF